MSREQLYTCLLILQFPIFFMIFYKYFFLVFFCRKRSPKYKFKNRNSKEILNKVEVEANNAKSSVWEVTKRRLKKEKRCHLR